VERGAAWRTILGLGKTQAIALLFDRAPTGTGRRCTRCGGRGERAGRGQRRRRREHARLTWTQVVATRRRPRWTLAASPPAEMGAAGVAGIAIAPAAPDAAGAAAPRARWPSWTPRSPRAQLDVHEHGAHASRMGGKEARDGFWFQDAKALTRLLDDALERHRRRVLGLDLDPELRVRVESTVEVVIDRDAQQPEPQPPRPTWDGTFAVGYLVVVDECKLGGPTRDDRVTLYRRLRATIAGGVPIGRLVPRLTVGRESIADPDRWHRLGTAAQFATAGAEPLSNVDTVEKLATEALYYLTTPTPIWSLKKDDKGDKSKKARAVPATPALSLDDARALLSRFELDASSTIDDVEEQLRTQLITVGAALAVDELVDLLRGWIDRVARTRDWQADLTADSLTDSLTLMSRYLTVAAPVERLWHRLREAVPPAPVTMIAVQPWREVQPNVDEVVRDRTVARRVAFTSEGGIGKSFLLTALHAEQPGTRVWVDAVAPLQDLEEALALGAWAAHRTEEALTIFVDAIDQVADPAALLGTIERALGGDDRAVVYVATRFATWTDIRDRLPGWRGVRLARWSDDRIRVLVQTGRAEPLSVDLIDLLRTPLLLDLFLRTFAAGDVVPAGLATRHGVLRAYFERRVYGDATATARRAVLDAGVAAVLANGVTWRNSTPAAHQLTSEGVIVSAFGELRFRHALLRDFSAALQFVPRTAEEIAGALRDVTNPIVRNELLRGIIEAQLDPESTLGGPSVEELVRECTRHGLAPGIALGTTDAPTPALLVAIAAIEGGSVLRQTMTHAHLIDNRAWLRIPGVLGGERPGWFGEAQLQAMASLAEFAFATGDAAGAALASTLRTWTWGHHVSGGGSWPITKIGALLVRSLPDDTTAQWYESLELGDTGFKSWFLEQLRDLSANPRVDDAVLSGALDKVVFGAGSHVLDGGHSLWEVTNLCLSDHDGNSGLLATRPHVALALLFRLNVERKLEEDRRRRSIRPDPVLAEMFANLPPPPVDLVEAETRLRIEPTLTKAEAVGDLVDDAQSTDRHAFDYLETLIEEVAQRAGEEVTFAERLAAAAVASRSVHARIIVLSLRGSTRIDEISLDILHDPRIYHFRYASGALWDAIHARWSTLTSEARSDVQKNILARARSPLLPFTQVGRLASAIPRDELEPALQPYVKFLEVSGRSTAPTRPARVEAFSGDMGDEDSEVHAADSGWQRFEALAVKENDQVAAAEALAMLRAGAADLTADTSDSIWFAVSRVIGRDEKHDERALDAETARVLFEAALGAVESRRRDPGSWGTLLDIADACPSYFPENEALAMRTRIIAEIVAGTGEHAEHQEHAWRALVFVRPIAWFSDGTGGRAVFESWFRGSLNGEGLQSSLRMLPFVPGDTRLDLVRHVLETDNRLDMAAEGHAFINEAGRLLGAWSIWWTEQWARDLIRNWCDAAVRPGALAPPAAWRQFISGFAWSLQNQVRHVSRDPRAEPVLGRFGPLLEQSWTAWRTVIDDAAGGNISVGWSVVAPLAKRFTTQVDPPAGGWSVRLRQLVARVVAEGGRNDISAFQQVDWAVVDPETLALVADAAIARADQEITSRPPTDWMIDGLIAILGAIGQLAAVPLSHARQVLDCLQRLGRSASKATSAAMAVEREVRAREIPRDH